MMFVWWWRFGGNLANSLGCLARRFAYWADDVRGLCIRRLCRSIDDAKK